MDLIKKLLFYISVPKCVFCGERLNYGELPLCNECIKSYIDVKARDCSKCGKQLSRCKCSNTYLKAHYVKDLVKVYKYMGRGDEQFASNHLIFSLKRDNRRDVVDFLKNEIVNAIHNSIKVNSDFVITSVPRRRVAIIHYGYDHAKVLANAVAKELGIKFISPLKSNSTQAQKGKHGQERMKNASFSYRRDINLKGKTVLLLDDVVTTGASMGACATLLKGLDAKRVIGVCIATAFKDNA